MPAKRVFDRHQVSSIIMEAIDLGLPIVPTIEAVTGVSHNRARYMVRIVKEDGFLGQAPHHPARAVLHRGSPHEDRFLACVSCHYPWPCRQAFPNDPCE